MDIDERGKRRGIGCLIIGIFGITAAAISGDDTILLIVLLGWFMILSAK
jgi:hypothetical protein